MSNCVNKMPGGVNADCLKTPSPVKTILIATKDVSFSSDADFINRTTWETKIKTDLKVWMPGGLASYERTTDDPTINTNPFGQKYVTRQGVPSMVAYLEANTCDYNEQRATFKGGIYQVFFVLEDNTLMGRRADLGTIKGFRAKITATGADIPIHDATENSYPLFINFQSSEEWEKRIILDPVAWNPNVDLIAAMPMGLNITQTTTYGTSVCTVKVFERCGDPCTIIDAAADFEILGSNDLVSPAVTSVDVTGAASGTYILTVQKGSSPVTLAAGDWVMLRVKVLSSTTVTHLSNVLIVRG